MPDGTNHSALHALCPVQFRRFKQLPFQRQTYVDIWGVFPYRLPVLRVVDPYGDIQPGFKERPLEGACLPWDVLDRDRYPIGLSKLEEMGA